MRGVVLRKHIDIERLLPAGTGVYEIGTYDTIDVIADVLSTEAELLRNGMHASIKREPSDITPAVVERIDPSAFTKLSALGIEEQRVRIVLRPLRMMACGDGYRVSGRITLWRKDSALRVPANALVVQGTDTTVFVVANGRAQKISVRLGVRSKDYAQVVRGIEKGTTVIVNPPLSLTSESRIKQAE
jgi:HlyD family secretion protein